jgi:hypothetical protein
MKMKKRHIQRKKLLLYCIDEISTEEKNRIAAHLQECSQCKKLLNSEKKIIEYLRQYPKPEASEILLTRCRQQFKKVIKEQSQKSRFLSLFAKLIDIQHAQIPKVQIVFATLIFITGFLLGRFLFNPGGLRPSTSKEIIHALQTGSAIENIQIIPLTHKTGEVEIQYRTKEKRVLRGNIKNPEIRSALSYALMKAPKDNIRLRSIGLLKEESGETSVQKALIHALQNDGNPGVRLKAIRILKNLPINDKLKHIFLYVLLKDTNPGIRFEAAKFLTRTQDPGIEAVLKNQASKEQFIQALLSKSEHSNPIPVSRDR